MQDPSCAVRIVVVILEIIFAWTLSSALITVLMTNVELELDVLVDIWVLCEPGKALPAVHEDDEAPSYERHFSQLLLKDIKGLAEWRGLLSRSR